MCTFKNEHLYSFGLGTFWWTIFKKNERLYSFGVGTFWWTILVSKNVYKMCTFLRPKSALSQRRAYQLTWYKPKLFTSLKFAGISYISMVMLHIYNMPKGPRMCSFGVFYTESAYSRPFNIFQASEKCQKRAEKRWLFGPFGTSKISWAPVHNFRSFRGLKWSKIMYRSTCLLDPKIDRKSSLLGRFCHFDQFWDRKIGPKRPRSYAFSKIFRYISKMSENLRK